MAEFSNRWERSSKESVSQKIKSSMNPPGDLRKKLVDTDRSLTNQITRLDKNLLRMAEKERSLFNRTTTAFQKHDTVMAQAYASELSEHRKAIKLVQGAKLSLERVQGRLKTITDVGDLATVIAPVGQVVKSVRTSLQGIMPSANDELSGISAGLDGMMQEIGSVPGIAMNFEAKDEEAEKILAEASAIAETKVGSTLPTIPDQSDNISSSSI